MPALPATGAELQRRLQARDGDLARQQLCPPGALVKAVVVAAGVIAGYDADLTTWAGQALLLAVESARKFEASIGPA